LLAGNKKPPFRAEIYAQRRKLLICGTLPPASEGFDRFELELVTEAALDPAAIVAHRHSAQ
jgi:hypothetical protein